MQIFKIEFAFKIVKKYGDKMKNSSKILLGFMLVMMICCISAVSATDINGTDDTLITDDVAVDDVSEIVEDVEIDDASDDVVVEQNLRNTTGTINGNSYTNYFDENGNLNDTTEWQLIFNGYFDEVSSDFGNFKINRYVTLDVTNATFHNIGFDLNASALNLNGGTFVSDENATNGATIRALANSVIVNHTTITVNAPENKNYYAIDVEDASAVRLLNNVITYTCEPLNAVNYNYAIKAKNSSSVNIISNNITADVPLKNPNWDYWMSIDSDYVAGVAIENCDNAQFLYNNLTVIGNRSTGEYATLDAFIIAQSQWVHVEHNKIVEKDIVTKTGSYSYIYGIDVYSCNGIIINNNTVTMNGDESGGHIEGGNGTGAAYCVQLSGNHSGVVVSNNILTTQNNGPNLAIYSQNYHAQSFLNITGNTIKVTGKAGSDPWSLVSGIEVQDTRATVSGNTITVNNTANYTYGNYAFGISYAQWTNHTHYYDIELNTVNVINGDYAVYIMDSMTSGAVLFNTLSVTGNSTKIGDDAVNASSLLVGGNS